VEEEREEEEAVTAPEHLHHAYAQTMTSTKPHALHGLDPPAPARHRVRHLVQRASHVSITATSLLPRAAGDADEPSLAQP
jgi:hypothetical protein